MRGHRPLLRRYARHADAKDFHPINTLSVHKIKYVSDFAALLAITRGLIMIDEIDYVTHRKFDVFQQWMQDSKAHPDLHIVVLSAHPCPTASDNEISWFGQLEHCGFFRMNLVDEPKALPKGLPENCVPLDLSTPELIDELFDELRRTGPVVVHITADHDFWPMFEDCPKISGESVDKLRQIKPGKEIEARGFS